MKHKGFFFWGGGGEGGGTNSFNDFLLTSHPLYRAMARTDPITTKRWWPCLGLHTVLTESRKALMQGNSESLHLLLPWWSISPECGADPGTGSFANSGLRSSMSRVTIRLGLSVLPCDKTISVFFLLIETCFIVWSRMPCLWRLFESLPLFLSIHCSSKRWGPCSERDVVTGFRVVTEMFSGVSALPRLYLPVLVTSLTQKKTMITHSVQHVLGTQRTTDVLYQPCRTPASVKPSSLPTVLHPTRRDIRLVRCSGVVIAVSWLQQYRRRVNVRRPPLLCTSQGHA